MKTVYEMILGNWSSVFISKTNFLTSYSLGLLSLVVALRLEETVAMYRLGSIRHLFYLGE